MLHIACFIFEQMELLDFAGPYEVFSLIERLEPQHKVKLSTFGLEARAYRSINGLDLKAEEHLESLPRPIDILLLPGGEGSKPASQNPDLQTFIKEVASKGTSCFSVCSGARFLAYAGLLEGKEVVTHHSVYADLAQISPKSILRKDLRFSDNGTILTSGGIAAGIDAALYLVEKLFDEALARKIQNYMEYGENWRNC